MKSIVAIVLALACALAHGQVVIESRQTQVSYLQITNGVSIREAQVHSVCAPLVAWQVVSVFAQAEITSGQGFNVGIGSVIKAWDYYVDRYGNSSWIRTYNAIPPTMSNVTPAEHHKVIRVSFADTVNYEADANTRCYTLVLWAVASGGGGSIAVEQGYGFIQVLAH